MNNSHLEKIDSTFYMDVSMVSRYLHVAKSTIYKWVEGKYIPHKKLGKRVIFIKEHIDEWVLNNGVIVEDLPEVPKYKPIVKEQPSDEYHRRPEYRPAA